MSGQYSQVSLLPCTCEARSCADRQQNGRRRSSENLTASCLKDAKWAARVAEVEKLEDFDPTIAARARQTLIDQNYDLEMPREGTLITVNGLPEYAKLVTAMSWSIVRGGRGDFITCDSPLAHLASPYAPSGYVDIRERQSTLSFPLTSSICWVFEKSERISRSAIRNPND